MNKLLITLGSCAALLLSNPIRAEVTGSGPIVPYPYVHNEDKALRDTILGMHLAGNTIPYYESRTTRYNRYYYNGHRRVYLAPGYYRTYPPGYFRGYYNNYYPYYYYPYGFYYPYGYGHGAGYVYRPGYYHGAYSPPYYAPHHYEPHQARYWIVSTNGNVSSRAVYRGYRFGSRAYYCRVYSHHGYREGWMVSGRGCYVYINHQPKLFRSYQILVGR